MASCANYAEDWMKYYTEKGYAEVDPVRRQVMLTTHPFLWDRLNAAGAYSDDQHIMMHEAQDAGLVVPAFDSSYCTGSITR